MLLPVPSFAEWTKVGVADSGNTIYVDFKKIKKADGYVHWWELWDLLKPNEWGTLSIKVFNHGDCEALRAKVVTYFYHNKSMGKGDVYIDNGPNDWRYPPSNSTTEDVLKVVCKYAEKM